jgi:hypothetical protein
MIWDIHPGSGPGFFPIPDPVIKKALLLINFLKGISGL